MKLFEFQNIFHQTGIIGIFCVLVAAVSACSTVKNVAVAKDIDRTLNQSSHFSNQFTGFSLYDLEEEKYVAGHNDTKPFTPASNTKILTMYATLKSFQDSIPGLLYEYNGVKLRVQPNGDGTFLDSRFKNQPAASLLQDAEEVEIVWPVNELEKYGSGWAWDDYNEDDQSIRNWWPIYNNKATVIKKGGSLSVVPSFFADFLELDSTSTASNIRIQRNLMYNLFQVSGRSRDTATVKERIPFELSKDLLVQLLEDTLKTKFTYANTPLTQPDTLQTQALDHVLSLMMKVSDNHLAEQLLIQSAWANGYTSTDPFIKHAKLIWMSELNEMVWVDGSGLSRYNLIAPVDLVRILRKAQEEFGLDRILNILAVGGESGTIKNWYGADEAYVFAKTGTLRNNHNLSGFLRTRSGKWMIFSFMNNHFTVPLDQVKMEMQKLLENIRDSY